MKRLFDVIAVMLAGIPICLLVGVTALIVRRKLGSPIFFTQLRPGLNGVLFRMVKFRSMSDRVDEAGVLLPDEERLTPFGEWLRSSSLDELPCLWNVLKGDMSLVGPRPLLPEYLELYNERQKLRQTVMPGVTGWSQINGRNSISWEKKLEMDVWYVENRSFLLDLKIIMLTIKTVLNRSGVSAESHVTMPRFEGTKTDDKEV